MSIVAPNARTHLSADALWGLGRNGFAHIPDDRLSKTASAFAEALMAACAMFSRQAPSLLAFDKERGEGHLHTIDGIARVPCDPRLRAMLAPVSPKVLRPVCTSLLRQLPRGTALEPRAFREGHSLLALDGTEYVSSKTRPGASCLQRSHRPGAVPSAHPMLGAALLHLDPRAVMPLMPEALMHRDGTEKNDGARNAATRFVATRRQEHPHLKVLMTAASLSANAPPIAPLQADALR
jgi:hypothetical protein